MVFEVYGIQRATSNYGVRESTIQSFNSEQEAQAFLNERDRRGRPVTSGLGYDQIKVREVAQETGIDKQVTPPGYNYNSSNPNKRALQDALARQADTKIQRGEQISSAEAEARGISRQQQLNYNQNAKFSPNERNGFTAELVNTETGRKIYTRPGDNGLYYNVDEGPVTQEELIPPNRDIPRPRQSLPTVRAIAESYYNGPLPAAPVQQEGERPVGTLTRATPQEVKAMAREQNPFFMAFNSISTGVKAGFGNEEAGTQLGQDLRTGSGTASLFGLSSFLLVSTIGEGESAAERVIGKAPAIYKGLRNTNRASKLLFGTGESLLIAKTAVYGVEKVSEATAPKEQKEIIENPNFDLVIGSAFKAQEEAQPGFLGSIANSISLGLGSQKSKAAALAEAETQFRAMGYEGKDLDNALAAYQRQRKALILGEAAGQLTPNIFSEAFGTGLVSTTFEGIKDSVTKKAATGKVFRATFFNIGLAGITEGVAINEAQNQARKVNLPFFSSNDFGYNLINPFEQSESLLGSDVKAGAYGFFSAGLFGGTIAATSVNRKATSKVLQYASYFSDPFELPGDVGSDVLRGGANKFFGVDLRNPVLMESEKAVKFGVRETKGRALKVSSFANIFSFGGPSAQTPVNLFENQPSYEATINNQIQTPTQARTPVNSLIDIINNNFVVTPSPTPTPTNVNIPVVTPTPTPTPNPTQNPADVLINSPVNIFSFTETPVPVNVPFGRVPPPFPFELPIFDNPGGSRVGKPKAYIRELDLGAALLGNLIANTKFAARDYEEKVNKTKATKSQGKQKSKRYDFDFNLGGFFE